MTDNITKLRNVQLELIRAFTDVCEEKGLKYYAFFGTLLGIARGEGYLPWDGDADFVMPSDDYKKLCENKDWFDTEKYYLQTPLDPGNLRFAKLKKNGTTVFSLSLTDELKAGGHHGISIDIIPLEIIPESGCYHTPSLLGKEKKKAVYEKSWFEPCTYGKFEDLTLRMPAKPRKVLTEVYGLWAWPFGAEVCSYSNWFFDTEKGYEYYVRKYAGMLDGIEGKKIFLFGAADSLRIWLEKFGLRDQVICTFDNDPGKWGKTCFDVEVRDPSTLPSALDENSRVIIVSLWHQEIGKQLEKMGIDDYYVFLDDYYDESVGNPVIRREDKDKRGKDIPKWNED